MKSVARKLAASSISLGAIGVVALPLQSACTVTTVASDGGALEAGAEAATEAGAEAAVEASSDAGQAVDANLSDGAAADGPVGDAPSSPLGFTPSNLSLSAIDLSKIADEDVTTSCEIRTGIGDLQSCFTHAGDGIVMQSDGSQLHVIVVKSLRVEPTAHVSVTTGGLPLAIVSLGDMTLLGPIDAHAANSHAYAGGFASTQANTKGAGPGGGPGATGQSLTPGASAGGGSYCGLGGQGVLELNANGQPGMPTPAYGTPEIVPLIGGSSGGAGDIGAGAGGGALQLVAGGKFSMSAGSYINVGGGGGNQGGTTGQDSGGGGSGGSILIEAMTVSIAGALTANGAGGGGMGTGANDGHDATADSNPASGGPGSSPGGAGSAASTINGGNTTASTTAGAGGGGGGAGRVRINSMSGSADLTGATISPAVGTSCVTQGKVKP